MYPSTIQNAQLLEIELKSRTNSAKSHSCVPCLTWHLQTPSLLLLWAFGLHSSLFKMRMPRSLAEDDVLIEHRVAQLCSYPMRGLRLVASAHFKVLPLLIHARWLPADEWTRTVVTAIVWNVLSETTTLDLALPTKHWSEPHVQSFQRHGCMQFYCFMEHVSVL